LKLKPKVVSILLAIFWWQQIGWCYCAASRTVSWHDAITRKRSLCQENVVLLMVWRLCVTVAMVMVLGLTLTLPTFFSLLFFRLHLGVGVTVATLELG